VSASSEERGRKRGGPSYKPTDQKRRPPACSAVRSQRRSHLL
jgi:hypothetical protein